MPPIQADFYILAVTLATGAALGLVYDCWQVVFAGAGDRRPRRRRRRGRPVPVWYWLTAAGLTWCVLMVAFGGMMRGFMLLGLGIGGAIYALTLSGPVRGVLGLLKRLVAISFAALIDAASAVILFPVRLLTRILVAVASFLGVVLAGPGRLVLVAADWVGVLAGRLWRAAAAPFGRPRRPK